MDIEEIKMKEIALFVELTQSSSMRDLARRRNMSPGQISKLIAALERKLGVKLVERSSVGIRLTTKAQEILPSLREIHDSQESLSLNFEAAKEAPQLTFASTSFLSSHFLPTVLAQHQNQFPGYKTRLLDLPPDLFLPVALRNGFQICVHVGEMDWPKTWTAEKVGQLHWVLCARKNHPGLSEINLKSLLKYPFVYPIYWTPEGITSGKDHFPKTSIPRVRGIETATAVSAVEIVRLTNHLGFLPEILVDPLCRTGQLVKVELPQLKSVSQSVFITVKSDKLQQKMFQWLIDCCQRVLAR